MQIIPVLDLRQGAVVHARMGQRELYRPLESRLCPGHDALALCRALLDLGRFPTLYIADLDAICGNGDNHDLVREIHQAFPELQLWLDAGRASVALACEHLVPVLGTESLHSCMELQHILSLLGGTGCILSLDFNGNLLLGPQGLLQQISLWPRRIIVMSLDRVGADEGPDLRRLRDVTTTAPDHILYAAGGVRGRQDLEVLSAAGIQGALVASALHDGRIDRQDILTLAARQA